MTAFNMYRLAETGQLGQSMFFGGYCTSAAIDACFNTHDVPVEVYAANRAAVTEGELGREGVATDKFYELLGSLAFNDSSAVNFAALLYYFTNLEEFKTDLAALRHKATVLLDTNDGLHSVGLKPVGVDANKWKIVGTHQIVAVEFEDGPLDVQCMVEPETISTEEVWEYLLSNNSPGAKQQTALVFPAEPRH